MKYPLEVLKNQYITVLKIETNTVKLGQAGLNEDALRHTHMIPYQDKVFILDANHRNKPILFQKMYQIIPLKDDIAMDGEVVVHESPLIEEGSLVIMNNVLRVWF